MENLNPQPQNQTANTAGDPQQQTNQVPADKLTFQQGITELDSIVSKLESNTMELEDSLKAYERGVELLRSLRSRLDKAQQKVDVLMGNLEENPTGDEADTGLHKA